MKKKLLIITPNLRDASTGGLAWLDKFAAYAKTNYELTHILDVSSLSPFLTKFRILNLIYYLFYLSFKSRTFCFVDHSLHMRLSFPLFVSKILKGNRYAVICFHVLHPLRNERVTRKIEFLSERLLLKHAQVVIVASHNTDTEVRKLTGANQNTSKKIVMIYPTFVIKGTDLAERKNNKKLLSVGSIEPRKGLDILLKALALLKDSDITLDIVGSSYKQQKYREYLMALIKDLGLSNKVRLHGRVQNDELVRFYREANIFVFPSRHEGYGMVICEAMSFGLPIVASNISPINEIIRDNENGYLFTMDDHEMLADRLRKLLSNQALQREIGRRNYNASQQFPTWEQVIQRTYNAVHPYFYLEDLH